MVRSDDPVPDGMTIDIDREETRAIVHLKGGLDARTFEDLQNAVDPLLERGVDRIAFDLDGLELITSAGCGVLLGVDAELERAGGKVALASIGSRVAEVFDLLGLMEVFTAFDTLEEALAYLDED